MRIVLLLLVGTLPLAACMHSPERMVEADGIPRGGLAVAAIDRGDFNRAERLLADSSLDAGDPARLINLGYVYLEQGRREEALRAWRGALAAERHTNVVTMNGRQVRTDQLAREVLARFDTRLAARQ